MTSTGFYRSCKHCTESAGHGGIDDGSPYSSEYKCQVGRGCEHCAQRGVVFETYWVPTVSIQDFGKIDVWRDPPVSYQRKLEFLRMNRLVRELRVKVDSANLHTSVPQRFRDSLEDLERWIREAADKLR